MFEDIFKTLKLVFFQLAYSEQHRMGFQPPASINFERIIDLHHFVFFYLIIILMIVLWLLISLIDNFSFFYSINNNDMNVNEIKSRLLFNYTNKIKKKFKFGPNKLINFLHELEYKVEYLPEKLSQESIKPTKQLIGLIEHFNLYLRFVLAYLLIDKV